MTGLQEQEMNRQASSEMRQGIGEECPTQTPVVIQQQEVRFQKAVPFPHRPHHVDHQKMHHILS
jgi:hypothetical protein